MTGTASILLVGRSDELRGRVHRLLGSRHAVEAQPEAQAARRALADRRFDLAIVDAALGPSDAQALATMLRDRGSAMLLLCGAPGTEPEIREADAALLDYLVAPFSDTELLRRVRASLELARLRGREAALRSETVDYLEGLMEGFAAYDAGWRITYLNGAGERLLNRRRGELIGKPFLEAFPASRGTVFQRHYEDVMRTRVPARLEAFHPHYGAWFEVNTAPLGNGGIGVYFRDVTDRKQAELAVKASEETLSLAQRAARAGVWDYDVASGVAHWSLECHRLYGTDPARFSPSIDSWAARVHPEDRAGALEALQEAMTGRQELNIEFRVEHPERGIVWLWEVGRAQYDEFGRAVRMAGIVLDVTERKLADDALRESENRFRTLANHAPVGIFQTDAAGDCQFVNATWERFAGLGFEQARGKGWMRALHPDDRDRVAAEWYAAAGRRAVFASEYRFLRPDGTVTWLQGSAIELRGARDELLGYLGTVADISERRRAEEALRTSEQLYRAIGESIDYGIWICDASGRNIYASPSFLELVGITQEQCSAFGWADVLHPDEADETMRAWRQCCESGDVWEREHRFRGRDGAWHHVLARGVPIHGGDGRVLYWAGINLDIGRLKRVESELREADRRKDEFLATLAHELRNPLAPIRNGLHLLGMSAGEPRVVDDVRAMMERQLAHLVRLVDDLLDISRVTRGRVELRRSRVTIADVVGHALETSRPAIEAGRHQLSVSLPEAPLEVDGDPVRLGQVLSNMMNNAAKYTRDGGHISLTAAPSGGEIRISVRDNGMGIPADMLPRVFDLFAQVDRTLNRSQGGLGIGLALSRRIAEMHGGRLEARSDGPGLGSEFVLCLPAAQPGGASQAHAEPGPHQALTADEQ